MTVHNIRVGESKRGDASDGAADAVGGRLSRVDGPAKITGAAKYAVEQQLDGLAYAVLVESTIASGKVRSIDTAAAEAAPGVLKVLTPDTIISLRTASDWFGTPPLDAP
jgi:xanthine dehydrogenase YagR molybdenum-binding subunit